MLDLAEFLLQLNEFLMRDGLVGLTHNWAFSLEKTGGCA
jgi:hypothetical protein